MKFHQFALIFLLSLLVLCSQVLGGEILGYYHPGTNAALTNAELSMAYRNQFITLRVQLGPPQDDSSSYTFGLTNGTSWVTGTSYQFIHHTIDASTSSWVPDSTSKYNLSASCSDNSLIIAISNEVKANSDFINGNFFGTVVLRYQGTTALPMNLTSYDQSNYDQQNAVLTLSFTNSDITRNVVPGRYRFSNPSEGMVYPITFNVYNFLRQDSALSLSCWDASVPDKVVARIAFPDFENSPSTDYFYLNEVGIDVFALTKGVVCKLPFFYNIAPTIDEVSGTFSYSGAQLTLLQQTIDNPKSFNYPIGNPITPYYPLGWTSSPIFDAVGADSQHSTRPTLTFITNTEENIYNNESRVASAAAQTLITKGSTSFQVQFPNNNTATMPFPYISGHDSSNGITYTISKEVFLGLSKAGPVDIHITYPEATHSGRTLAKRWMPSFFHLDNDQNPIIKIDDFSRKSTLIIDMNVGLKTNDLNWVAVMKNEGLAITLPIFQLVDLDDSWGDKKAHCDVSDVTNNLQPQSLQSITSVVEDTLYIHFVADYSRDIVSQNSPALRITCYLRTLPSLPQRPSDSTPSTLWTLLNLAATRNSDMLLGVITPIHPIMGYQSASFIEVGIDDITHSQFLPAFSINPQIDEDDTTPDKEIDDKDVVGPFSTQSSTSQCVALITFPTNTYIDFDNDAQNAQDIAAIRGELRNKLLVPHSPNGIVVFPLEHSVAMDTGSQYAGLGVFGTDLAARMQFSRTLNQPVLHQYSALIILDQSCGTYDGVAWGNEGVMSAISAPGVDLAMIKSFLRSDTCYMATDTSDETQCQQVLSGQSAGIFELLPRFRGKFPLAKKAFGEPCQSHSECVFSCELPLRPVNSSVVNSSTKTCSTNPIPQLQGYDSIPMPSPAIFSAAARQSTDFLAKVGLSPVETFTQECGKFPTKLCCDVSDIDMLPTQAPACNACVGLVETTADPKRITSCLLAHPHLDYPAEMRNMFAVYFNPSNALWDAKKMCFIEALPQFVGYDKMIESTGEKKNVPVLHRDQFVAMRCHNHGYFTPQSLLALGHAPLTTINAAFIDLSPSQLFIQANNNVGIPAFYKPSGMETRLPYILTGSETLYWSGPYLAELLVKRGYGYDPTKPFKLRLIARDPTGSAKIYIHDLSPGFGGHSTINLVEFISEKQSQSPLRLTNIRVHLIYTVAGQTPDVLLTTAVLTNLDSGYTIEYRPANYVEPPVCLAETGQVLDPTTSKCVCKNAMYVLSPVYGVCVPVCQCVNGNCQYFKNSSPSAFATPADAANGDINFFNYQCMCDKGWYHRFCDVPVKCRVDCPLVDGKPDPFATPMLQSSGNSRDPSTITCDTTCNQCIKGFEKVNGKCACKKMVERTCNPTGTHTVAQTAARCLIDGTASGELVLTEQIENISDLQPWLKNVPCPCRYGYAGAKCDYEAAYFTFEILDPNSMTTPPSSDPKAYIFGSSSDLRVYWYDQVKNMLSQIIQSNFTAPSLYMSLYAWDKDTFQITIQVWLQPIATGIPFVTTASRQPLNPTNSHPQLYNRLLALTRNAVAQLQQTQSTTSLMSPLADLEDLYNLWDQVSGSSDPVNIVDNEQASFPVDSQNPRCANVAYAQANQEDCAGYTTINYDAQYGEEMEQDQNQTNFMNDLTYIDDSSSSSNTTTVIIIAVVVPIAAILLFILLACSIKYCHKKNKFCFASPQTGKSNISSNTAEITMTPTTNNSTQSSRGRGSKSAPTSSLPASIMPSHTTTTATSSSSKTTSSLPPNWQEQTDHATGKTYYINLKTMESSWTHPGQGQTTSGW